VFAPVSDTHTHLYIAEIYIPRVTVCEKAFFFLCFSLCVSANVDFETIIFRARPYTHKEHEKVTAHNYLKRLVTGCVSVEENKP